MHNKSSGTLEWGTLSLGGTTNQAPMLANEGTNRTILMGGGSDRALRQGLGGTVGHPCPHSTPRHHLNP